MQLCLGKYVEITHYILTDVMLLKTYIIKFEVKTVFWNLQLVFVSV